MILHPFADAAGAIKLVEASRASLALRGLIPVDTSVSAQIDERLLAGRYCELMMLFYLGKDLERWLLQCADFTARTAELRERGLRPECFTTLLMEEAPAEVKEKLVGWGVDGYTSIFGRSLGLHAIFEALPPRELLAGDFLRHYHRFADCAFACRRQLCAQPRLSGSEFDFQLYASGEYAKMLEQEWELS